MEDPNDFSELVLSVMLFLLAFTLGFVVGVWL